MNILEEHHALLPPFPAAEDANDVGAGMEAGAFAVGATQFKHGAGAAGECGDQ